MVHFADGSAVAWHSQNYEVVELVTWLAFRLESVVVESGHPKYLLCIEFIRHRVSF